jgi:ABC-type Fe3+/spermidine/putrescine transport system ATPase subunit
VTLFVRPERISIVAEKPLQSLPAIVIGRTYLGRHFEFNLRLEDGSTWTANAVDQAAFFSFDVGAQVLLHIEPANVIVIRRC